jgi:hypothetical protein
MTASNHRRKANKRNAQSSTGPRSRSGKLKVRKNALRHGLAAATLARRFPKRQVSAIVECLAGFNDSAMREAAEKFAVAHLFWSRIEALRQKTIKYKLRVYRRLRYPAGSFNSSIMLAMAMHDPDVLAIDRYERRAFNQRRRAAEKLPLV